MPDRPPTAAWYMTAALVPVATFSVTNALWMHSEALGVPWLPRSFPYDIAVDMLGGSGVALVALWLALKSGRLNTTEAGLAASGWKPWKILFNAAMVGVMVGGGLATLPVHHGTPTFRDYLGWFFILLGASTAEILVFVSALFCLTERCLRNAGQPWPVATLFPMVLAAVCFGVFHYTYPPRWHQFVWWPLTVVMLINLVYFVLSRNLWLTLLLHNGFAAVGFTQQQYAEEPLDQAAFLDPNYLHFLIAGFAVPLAVLLGLTLFPPWRAPADGVATKGPAA